MKLTVFLILLSFVQLLANNSYAQKTKLSVDLKNTSIEMVLLNIENQSNFKFIYNKEKVDVDSRVSLQLKEKSINETLDALFEGKNVSYTFYGNQVILTNSESESTPSIQQKSISGKVTDSSGASLPGVSVVVKGTTTGVITDMDGKYTLANVPENATLVFSFVGMKTQEVVVGGKTTINITLIEESVAIDEVVAVGYGVQKKVNLTGSIGVISAEKLENRSISNLGQALQGQVSGLKITQTGGQPGKEAINMQIRGQSSFTSNPVLTIVDGISSSINNINPNDIESISILKDASSTAIYGARAAGGVILITTKIGKKGKPKVNFDSYVGIQQVTRLPQKVTAFEHATLFREAELNDNPKSTVSLYSDAQLKLYSSPDWKDYDRYSAIFSDALQTQHTISISGGSENQDYFLSMGYLFEDGIVINTGYEKYNINYNQNIKLGEKLKLNVIGKFTPETTTAPSEATYPGGSSRGIDLLMSWGVYRRGNQLPIYTSNGDWATVEGVANIIGLSSKEGGQQIINNKTLSGSFKFDYSVTKDLKISGIYGLEWRPSRQTDYSAKMKFYNPDNPTVVQVEEKLNALRVINSSYNYHNSQFMINYNKEKGNHIFSALAGYTQEWASQNNETVGRRDFLTDNIYAISAGSTDPINWSTAGTMSDWALASFIGRATYSFKQKYLAETAMRYDGSSRFVKNIRWGFFPSLSAGWRITEEDFLKNNNILTNLKLRASWGQVGNQNIGNYPFASTLSSTNYYFNGSPQRAVYATGSPNPELTWETKTAGNIGLDANIKGSLLSFSVEVFKETTSDILLTVPLPTTYGKSTPVQNAGTVENKGWELELSHRNSFRDFSYGISFQISDATNKVVDLAGTGPWISGNTITEEGHPMYEWYGWKAEGFFQSNEEVTNHSFQHTKTSPGDIKYQENGGNPSTIDQNDRVRLGRSDPRFPYGVRFDFKYKNFDLTAFGQGVLSNTVFSNGWTAYNFDRVQSTLFTYQLDRWTPETPNARFPKTRIGGVNAQFSSFWLENAAYFRMKNIQVGYNLPQNVLSKLKLDRARIYLGAENLFTITKLLGFDPEIPTGSTSRLVESRYPLKKVYSLSVNLTF